MLDSLVAKGFQVEFVSHAEAILSVDFPEAVAELEETLLATTIPIEEIIAGGGGEAKGTQRLRKALTANPCPLVLIGLPQSIVTFNEGKTALNEVEAADAAEDSSGTEGKV
jgi:hypothetical protein